MASKRFVIAGAVVVVPVLAIVAGSALSLACNTPCKSDADCGAALTCTDGVCTGEGEGEGEGEGDDNVVEEGTGGSTDAPTEVNHGLPFALFGVDANGDGVHDGLNGVYRVTGIPAGTCVEITLDDFAGTLSGCPTTVSIELTGAESSELFGGLNGVDCPNVQIHVAADGSIIVNWQGDATPGFGLRFVPCP